MRKIDDPPIHKRSAVDNPHIHRLIVFLTLRTRTIVWNGSVRCAATHRFHVVDFAVRRPPASVVRLPVPTRDASLHRTHRRRNSRRKGADAVTPGARAPSVSSLSYDTPQPVRRRTTQARRPDSSVLSYRPMCNRMEGVKIARRHLGTNRRRGRRGIHRRGCRKHRPLKHRPPKRLTPGRNTKARLKVSKTK